LGAEGEVLMMTADEARMFTAKAIEDKKDDDIVIDILSQIDEGIKSRSELGYYSYRYNFKDYSFSRPLYVDNVIKHLKTLGYRASIGTSEWHIKCIDIEWTTPILNLIVSKTLKNGVDI